MSINHFSSEIPETIWWSTTPTQQSEPTQNPSTSSRSPINNSWTSQFHHHSWLNSQEFPPPPLFPKQSNLPCFNLNNNQDEEDEEMLLSDDNKIRSVHVDDDPGTINNNNNSSSDLEEKEAMFEKPLTPSDVGKLNRLVIPKQHAERYFPLGNSNGNGGGEDNGKGLLLSFEDESGKCWRFRYSYWNSSQSYVLTKGWSRYVKEKRLDAGDVVCFKRHRIDGERLFIGWRRRQEMLVGGGGGGGGKMSRSTSYGAHNSNNNNYNPNGSGDDIINGKGGGVGVNSSRGVGWTRVLYSAHPPYPMHHHPMTSQFQHDCLHAGKGGDETPQAGESGGSSSKILRLFGVNMKCHSDNGEAVVEEEVEEEPSSQYHHFYHHQPSYPTIPIPNSHLNHNHQGVTFHHMRSHQG